MKIGIGIDTGGTCTDAVAYDLDAGTLLAKGKALTTRENLSVGIGEALDALPPELIRDASLISLSTTLATNACVENKGGRAKLLIFGLTDELIHRFKAEENYGLGRDSVRCIDTHGSADGLIVDEPDWDAVFTELGDWLADADALAIAELYSVTNGAPCEKRAKPLLEARFGHTCICASDLTGERNVLTRGATALLNARLLPIVREFIEAALADFATRECTAPIMVVRSDGSLMSADLSLSRPVETILSGPAASVLTGRDLTGDGHCLILDMGGTTSDVSIVRSGKPTMASEGIRIGGWRTHVKGVFVDTFALGGDSAIWINEGRLRLFPRRAMPICSAAKKWPEIKPALQSLLERKHLNRFPLHEFLYLIREPAGTKHYTPDELTLIEALRSGPCMLSDLKSRANLDIYFFDSERLEAEGVVMRCGLTPTDFMHIKGDYLAYDREASVLAGRYLLLALGREDTPQALDALTQEVYSMVEGTLYENLVRILLAEEFPAQFGKGLDPQTEFFIRAAWSSRHAGADTLFRYSFGSNAALVGVGAPTHVFLPEVARALGAQCILPEHAEVANAIGALKADISASARVEISQRLADGELYYITHAPSGSRVFVKLDDAIALATSEAEEAAMTEAKARGALGELTLTSRVVRHSATSKWGTDVNLGVSVVAEAGARFV